MRPTRSRARTAAAIGLGLAGVVLGTAACSSGSDGPAPVPSPAPSPTLSAEASWFESACEDAGGMQGALTALGASVSSVPSSDAIPTVGAPGFTDARGGIQTRLGTVSGFATGLTTLTDPPGRALAPLGASVERRAAAVQDSVAELKASADAVTSSGTLSALSLAVRDLDAPLAATTADVDRLVAVLRAQAGVKDVRIRQAYAAAPACARLEG